MARGSPAHSSDSEDSAPELLTLSSTKKESRTRAQAVSTFEAAQKAKRKRENRARDVALHEAKERAKEERAQLETSDKRQKKRKNQRNGKEKVEAGGAETANAEERMERAMREAAGEDESGSEQDVISEDGDNEEWAGVAASDMDAEGVDITSMASSNHLPEHLFAAAIPQPTSSKTSRTESIEISTKRKRKRSKAKELTVGSRTLRTLSSSQSETLMASLTLPPSRINRFLKRTLHLKGSKTDGNTTGGGNSSKKKGKGIAQTWERRPVNLGALRTADGPARRFVREK